MSSPRRLLEVLGATEAPKVDHDFPPDCPGGIVRVTREDARVYRQGGEMFLDGPFPLPNDGYGTLRIMCRNPCQEIPNTTSGHKLFYGLCFSCSGVEEKNRTDLRNREQAKGGPR